VIDPERSVPLKRPGVAAIVMALMVASFCVAFLSDAARGEEPEENLESQH
jgi:hypothetical protein